MNKATARVIGNAGAFDVIVLSTPGGLTFVEQGQRPIEGVTFTTVFDSPIKVDTPLAERAQRPNLGSSPAFIAVSSRHLNIVGTVSPSQWHGACRIVE